ncbi:hypothetical protein BCR36DRAFT_306468 [Piromyces finnis]|uniref:Uncharacterized protein n=1 Tax=Piromyces finnis TaxID=1754191 RepID=A0A1Y1UX29_9FUNG|nr:hypothetical protein BCR36DRAFT_306468 [Piromyces finnis]|eukprot:ORX42670.1 hypothetical protein BCR36DRAFT_306468 [Piromyces finnis]
MLSNKDKSINDFNNTIYHTDASFKKWTLLKNPELNKISLIIQKHYSDERSKRINNKKRFVYFQCTDFAIRYLNSCNESCIQNKNSSTIKNLRKINRGRNIYNFSVKKELIKTLFYSLCFDENEDKLKSIKDFKIITPENITGLYKNNAKEIKDIMKNVIDDVTNNNLEEYCHERPYQTFLMFKLFSSLPELYQMSKPKIIEL